MMARQTDEIFAMEFLQSDDREASQRLPAGFFHEFLHREERPARGEEVIDEQSALGFDKGTF